MKSQPTSPSRSRAMRSRRNRGKCFSTLSFAFATSLGVWLPQASGEVIIQLDATSLSPGPLEVWPNTGTVAGDFTSAGAAVPSVETLGGVNGVTLVGGDTHYVGPNTTTPAHGNRSRTVEAWIYDDAPQDGGVIFAWARRGGPDGSNGSFLHGSNASFGAVGQWGAGDMGWNGNLIYGRWTHIAYSFDASTQTGKVYVDGKVANNKVFPPGVVNAHATDESGNPVKFRVGRQTTATGVLSGADLPANITVGRLRMHDVSLSDTEIAATFNSEKTTFFVDSDNDEVPDWYETLYGLNPNLASDASTDLDEDGLSAKQEYGAGTDPTKADTDGDGLSDGAEVNRTVGGNGAPTDPTKADTDGDGLSDGVETGTGTFVDATNTGSDPLKADTDGDTFDDAKEVSSFTNPNDPTSFPRADRGPLVNLDATTLPEGALVEWENTGPLGGVFVAAENAPANVEALDGVNGVTLDGSSHYYTGPNAPSILTGDSAHSVEAWIYNPSAAAEETIVAWGRRGGPDATNVSFNHGVDPTWGAVGHWGAPDIGWNGQIIEGRWTYVAYTYDPTTRTVAVYADGKLANTEVSGPFNIWATSDLGTALPIRVGSQNEANGSPTAALRGSMTIAKLRIYDRTLDAASIESTFNTEKSELWIDADNDKMPNWYEARYSFLDPNNPADAALDEDQDGLTNLQEFTAGTLADTADTDNDGLKDGDEVKRVVNGNAAPTNPLKADTDGDGLIDSVETGTGTYVNLTNTGTDPLKTDSDADGADDYREAANGSNPNLSGSLPSANRAAFVILDATGLEVGSLAEWQNLAGWGGVFVAQEGVPGNVEDLDGVRGVTLDGGGVYFTGPAAPPFIAGDNARTIDAWIYNPAAADEETIVAWGRRGGGDGSNLSFNHGANATFGAVGHWGAPDMGWNGQLISGQWTHVAYTYDPATKTAKVFSNGTVASSKNTGALSTWAEDTSLSPLPIRVGSQNEDNGTATTALRGSLSIGKLRIYDRALTDEAMKQLFDSEKRSFLFNVLSITVNPATQATELTWKPSPGTSYEVQVSSNLVDWTVLATGLTAGSYTDAQTPAPAPVRFYRLAFQ